MNALGQAALEAFSELLAHGGKTLTVGSNTPKALIQLIEPQHAQYSLEKDEGQDALIQVLKSDWPTTPRSGESFSDEDSLEYRITNVRGDHLFWHFRCAVTHV